MGDLSKGAKALDQGGDTLNTGAGKLAEGIKTYTDGGTGGQGRQRDLAKGTTELTAQ